MGYVMADPKLPARIFRYLAILLAMVFLTIQAGCDKSVRVTFGEPVAIGSLDKKARLESTRPTALELQARLMSYADRYLSKVAQATVNYEKVVKTPEAKSFGLSTFIFPGLTVVRLAAGGDPASDLINMVVFASLQREVMEDGWAEEVLGSHADELIAAQKSLEAQIWQLAGEVLTPIQQTELRELIKAWRKANPRQRFVSAVHLDEVAILRGKNSISRTLSDSSGLLAPIDKAAQEADDIRLLAERGVFLMERLPQLLMAQARYVVHEEIAPEQIDSLVKDFSAISGSMVEAQKVVAGFPQLITKERKAWLLEWDQRQDSFAALLARTAPVFDAGKGASADVRLTLAQLEKVIQTYEKNGKAINDTIERYQGLLKIMDSEPPSDNTKLLATLDALIRLGQEIDRLAARIQTTSGQKGFELAIIQSYEKLLNAFFWRVLLLVVGILMLIFAYRYLCQRYLEGKLP
jgi:hypothetical protein